MLNSPNDILDHQPPFIFVSADKSWLLISEIKKLEDCIELTVIEKKNSEFSKRTVRLDETPFHVGAEIWELNYGATLMTLNHSSLSQHPATLLWQEWIKYKKIKK
ncbi:MAG: hypothetical protein AAF304_06650 [Pseudomonadota bacterium]